jgi:hypothetical protein
MCLNLYAHFHSANQDNDYFLCRLVLFVLHASGSPVDAISTYSFYESQSRLNR